MAQRSRLEGRRVTSCDLRIAGPLLRASTGSHETEEAGTRPMGACDLLGDFREGRVARPGIFEAVLRHRDSVRAAMPFAHQPSARLQSKARIWTYPARCPEHLRQCLELAAGRLTEPTVLKLLAPIGDPAKEKIAADPWGLAAVKPPPLAAELVKAGACQISFCALQHPLRRGIGVVVAIFRDRIWDYSSLTSFEARNRALAPPQARNRSRALGVLRGQLVCLFASTTHASFASEVQKNASAISTAEVKPKADLV